MLPAATHAASPDTSAADLNAARLRTNARGLPVLGTWGLTNIAAGTVGYLATDPGEARAFWGMNALWGVVNTALAGFGTYRARKQLAQLPTTETEASYRKWRRDRRIFLINAGLDVVYAGAGVAMLAYGRGDGADNPAQMRGFGNALVMQGAALFLFDLAMWAAHGRAKGAWQKLLAGVGVSGIGVGVRLGL